MPTAASAAVMSAGEAIARTLAANGIDTVFGVPGAQTYPFVDGVAKLGNAMRFIGTRHEQAAAYMALGYAKATGRPSAYSVVPGPGVLNTGAALVTAWANNAPVLCVTGQIPSGALGKRRGHLHEIKDQLATLQGLVKWAAHIERPEQVPAVMDEAFRQMLSGRRGPVAISMSWDTMPQSASFAAKAAVVADPPPALDGTAIARAAELIAKAQRPLLLVGGGAQHASAEVRALAERIGVAVSAFRMGQGVLSADHPQWVSSYAAALLWKETDVLIAVGTRAEMPYMRWRDPSGAVTVAPAHPPLIRIDIDPEEMIRLVPAVGIVADAADGARALAQAAPRKAPRPDIEAARAQAEREIQKVQPHVAYLQVIREVLPRDGFFVEELCQAGFTSNFAFPVYEPRTYVSPGFQGTLGFGFLTALGVKVAQPHRAVVSITGDGGFMFGVQDLATAVEHDIGVVVVLFNNRSYGNVRRDLTRLYGHTVGADFRNPDFKTLAAAFGAAHARVSSPAELKPVLAQAIAADKPMIIEVMVDPDTEATPWPFIHTKTAL
jgi:acetolactate synthase I/II/III large subunit